MPGLKRSLVCASFACAVWLRWDWNLFGPVSPTIFASGCGFAGNPGGWLKLQRRLGQTNPVAALGAAIQS